VSLFDLFEGFFQWEGMPEEKYNHLAVIILGAAAEY
jgi:hypothetical protein